jgi:MFS family permease
VMVIITQNLPLRLSGTGFGVLTLCQNVGISLGPPVAGFLMQTTQSLVLTFSGISLFAFAGAVTALTIRTK